MRLINANELKEAFIEAGQNSGGEWGKNWKLTGKQIRDVINHAPTVDAVEVVRCKDCLHYYKGRNGWTCGFTGCTHIGDWYCADGEKKRR